MCCNSGIVCCGGQLKFIEEWVVGPLTSTLLWNFYKGALLETLYLVDVFHVVYEAPPISGTLATVDYSLMPRPHPLQGKRV